MVTKETAALVQKYAEIVNSEKNENRRKYWLSVEDGEFFIIERWRGRAARKENTTFTMSLDISGYSPLLGIDCGKYYTDPEENLKQQLRYSIWDFENLRQGRYHEKSVFCSCGAFDLSLFGVKVFFMENQGPWYDEKDHLLADKANLLKIKPIDFASTGLIPATRAMYEHHAEAVKDTNLTSVFPILLASPFGMAIKLRGYQNLLFDIIEDPDFVQDLMATITGMYKDFAKQRKEYLGEDSYPGAFFGNDEISTPVLSPAMYEEFIFPYEKELGDFYGSVRYWHSCGVTQAFYEQVSKLPNLKQMHIGPWSDIQKAVEVFGPKDISLEICRNDVRDMYETTYEEKVADLQKIKDMCEGKVRYQVRCDGIAPLTTIDNMLEKVDEWGRAATEVFGDPDAK